MSLLHLCLGVPTYSLAGRSRRTRGVAPYAHPWLDHTPAPFLGWADSNRRGYHTPHCPRVPTSPSRWPSLCALHGSLLGLPLSESYPCDAAGSDSYPAPPSGYPATPIATRTLVPALSCGSRTTTLWGLKPLVEAAGIEPASEGFHAC